MQTFRRTLKRNVSDSRNVKSEVKVTGYLNLWFSDLKHASI